MRNSFRLAALLLLLAVPTMAQKNSVAFTVNTALDTLSISPFIYGSNAQSDDTSAHVTARRLGGNRLTGYNWETNASNAGSDYLNHSDNYLTSGLTASVQSVPAIVPIQFHQASQMTGAYSLVTLPAAGYVARDENGTVSASETAPSPRWCKVVFQRDPPFPAVPDVMDGFVFVDEEVNYLVQKLGSSSAGGIRGYDCDNEPALWPNTHPRIHPNATTCAEVIARDSALAIAVKSVDPKAEIFGPVSYGFEEYLTNQSAPDWNTYKSYVRWLDAYLANMKRASDASGKRLLDVLDLHWYPEAQGMSTAGQLTRITPNDAPDAGIARARMDAPRTLWDSTYKENSWIAQYYSPVAILPWINAAIKKYNPGTKLSFSEFNYGGDHQISGAIAVADVLGIFGRYGVYMSNYWGTVGNYIGSAYRIYRNYDGQGSTFGNVSVRATTSNIDSTSIYAATRSDDPDHLDVILINKSLSTTFPSDLSIVSNKQFSSAQVFVVDASGMAITTAPAFSSLVGNQLHYQMPALSITHLVLQTTSRSVALTQSKGWSIKSASFTKSGILIHFSGRLVGHANVRLIDLLGNVTLRMSTDAPANENGTLLLPVQTLAPGFYELSVGSQGKTESYKIVSTHDNY